jgi:hypothetical protein
MRNMGDYDKDFWRKLWNGENVMDYEPEVEEEIIEEEE